MADPTLNPASQQWGRAVTASIGRVDAALTGAQQAAGLADSNLQATITRATLLGKGEAGISAYFLSLAIVRAESRTNAVGV